MQPRAIIRMGASHYDVSVPGQPPVDLSKVPPEAKPTVTSALIDHLGIKDHRKKRTRGQMPPKPKTLRM